MIPQEKYSPQQETLEKIKKEEKLKFPEAVSGRKPVAVLFLGTILLSLLFWLKGGIDFKGFKFFSSDKITFEKEMNQEELLVAIKEETVSLKGTYGIYVKELENGEEFGLNFNEEFTAASVNKLPVVLYFYKQVAEGKLNLDEEYTLAQEDIQDYGTGTMRYEKPGKVYSYADLARLSMKKSDNTANFVLTKILGRKNIQAWLEELGFKKTFLEKNTTTPKETSQLLEMLYKEEIVEEKYQEEILDLLTKTDFEDRLPKLLPERVRVAHKIGNETGIVNDCGIVFEEKPYVICILTKDARESEAQEILSQISRMIWEFFSSS